MWESQVKVKHSPVQETGWTRPLRCLFMLGELKSKRGTAPAPRAKRLALYNNSLNRIQNVFNIFLYLQSRVPFLWRLLSDEIVTTHYLFPACLPPASFPGVSQSLSFLYLPFMNIMPCVISSSIGQFSVLLRNNCCLYNCCSEQKAAFISSSDLQTWLNPFRAYREEGL